MSNLVPIWDLGLTPIITLSSNSLPNSLNGEVSELQFVNGQIALHGLAPPRLVNNTAASGTLESIVNQATISHPKSNGGDDLDLTPWFNTKQYNNRTVAQPITSESLTITMDAQVPIIHNGVARVVDIGVSESGTCGGGGGGDRCERELLGGAGYTATSLGTPGNTFSGKEYTADNIVCHSRSERKTGDGDAKKKGIGISSILTKRSRAAAIHNQSERKRRDKINERMKTLQKMVPNSNKTDKASMLDEVIEYLKQLQGQVNLMSRVMPPLMMPMAMQPQLQMAMMQMAATMGMAGMGMGVMDINRAVAGVPPTAPFMSWDNPMVGLPPPAAPMMPDPLSAFLAAQSQPMNMDAYSRLAMYHPFQQNPGPG